MKHCEVPTLRKKILRNTLCSKVFRADKDAYLVGGYLRDLIIKSIRSKDLDFVLRKNVRTTVNAVAAALGGRVVELRKERMLRVVLAGGTTLDFSKMQGTIEEDLSNRDFTINSMAWSPATGLIDPYGGLKDIRHGVVRAVSSQNLKNDPLRLVRAYRFSAELEMSVSRATRGLIRPLARKIRASAPERITLEFFKLLSSENPSKALTEALSDGVLNQIIPLSFNKLKSSIKSISSLDINVKKVHERLILKEFSQGLSIRGLHRLERLMIGAELDKALFSLSTDIRKRLEDTGRLYGEFKKINKMNKYNRFELFSAAGESAGDLLVLAGQVELLGDLKRFKKIQDRGLIGAEEVMKISGIGSGPGLGRVLRDMKRLQFAGELRTRQAARRWLAKR
jgi:tRNA nucleotidyltransferase/poly(A) polymerase